MHPDLTVLHAVVDQATKESAAAKKAFTEALHACQKNEEFTSFTHEDSSLGPESEDDGDHQPFTAVTVAHKTVPMFCCFGQKCLV